MCALGVSRSGTGARLTGRGGRKRCCNRTVGRIGVRPMSGQSLSFSILSAGWASSVRLVIVAVLVVLAFSFSIHRSRGHLLFVRSSWVVQRMAAEASEAEEESVHGGAVLGPSRASRGGPGDFELVRELKEQKVALNKQRLLLTKQLKNEVRKRQRLRERAKKLSNEDLVRVLTHREVQARAKAKPKAKPQAKSRAS